MRKLKERNDGLDFIRERSQQIKQEIRDRKNYKKDIQHELQLERTYKYNRQDDLRRLWKINNVMIEHYEKILEEHEAMLKEMEAIK